MNRYLYSSFTLILALLIMCGCQSSTIGKLNDNISTDKIFINLFEPNLNTNTFFEYNTNSQTKKTIQKQTIEEYTSFSFSKLHNKTFFADKARDNTIQLFEKDLKTSKTTQLTNELSSVDFIKIDKDQSILIMRVLLKNDTRNFHIATYNIDSNELKVWDEYENDRSILDFDYNPHNNKLVLVSYSKKEDTNKLEIANENNSQLLPPKYSFDVYSIEGNLEKHVAAIEKFISGVTFANDQKNIIFSYDEGLESPLSLVARLDIDTQEEMTIFTGSKKYLKISAVKYDKKGEGFFFLYNLYTNKNYNTLEIPKGSVLAYYDLKEKKTNDVWESKGIIVNYSLE